MEFAPVQTEDVSGELGHRALHAQADAEEGNASFAGEADGVDLALDAAFAETAGHQNAVHAGEQPFGPFALDRLAVDALDADLRPIVHAGMVERFVDRLVGVAMFGILAHHGDGDFVLRIAQPVQQIAPAVQVQRPGLQVQLADDQLVQAVIDQAHRHFVDRKILVLFLDHGLDRHVAEQGDFRPIVAA